jgi:hypothetical protein
MERFNNAAARAVNALSRDEADQFDAIVEDDPFLQRHFDTYRAVAAELTEGFSEIVPAASTDIWERIVEETGIGGHPEAPSQAAPKQRRRIGYHLATITAVAAALVIGVVIGRSMPTTPDLRDRAQQVAQTAGATTVQLTNPTNGTAVNASVVMAEDGTGFLVAESLPELADGRTYQLWVVVDGQVVSAALLGSNPDVVQFRAEGDIAGIAISEEVAGGVVVSEVDPTALWLRDA